MVKGKGIGMLWNERGMVGEKDLVEIVVEKKLNVVGIF